MRPIPSDQQDRPSGGAVLRSIIGDRIRGLWGSGFKPVVEAAGDCYARCAVRVRELYSSIDLIRRAIEEMPEGGSMF